MVILLSHQVFTQVAQDEELKHGEIDGNEIPLGKMMKSLKSQGTKAKKVKKKKSLPAEAKNAENDVDILKMVREINFENMGMSSKFESSNGHEHFPSKKTKKDREDEKGKKRKASDATSFPVPKRPRSSSTHSAFRSPASTSKATLRASGNDSHKARIDTKDKISMRKKMVEGSESDLLLSCIRKKTSFSSKDKGRYSDRGHNDEVNEVGEASDHDMEVSSGAG
jgi:sister-chromatid-cohesion protein PDS5